jgi:hypothetical protein
MARDATRVMPPIAGTAAAATAQAYGVFVKATAATHQRIAIPPTWRGRFVDFAAVTLDVYVVFGGSAVQAAADDQSSVTSEVITYDVNSAFPVFAGSSKTWKIPHDPSVTHFSFIASGATGRLIAAPADDPASTRA